MTLLVFALNETGGLMTLKHVFPGIKMGDFISDLILKYLFLSFGGGGNFLLKMLKNIHKLCF